MTADLASLHRTAAEAFADLAVEVSGGQWEEPTPCVGWNVRDLVNHVVSGNLWAAELAAGRSIEDVGDRLDGDQLGDDPPTAVRSSVHAAVAAFERAGVMAAPCAVSYGPVPGEVYCGHRTIDLVGHRWDLAVATGSEARIDPSIATAALDIIVPQFELLAASGMFGDAADPGAGTEPETRLLAMMGRNPADAI